MQTRIEKEKARSREKSRRYRREQPEKSRAWDRKFSQSPKGKFSSYRKQAINRGISFEITFEQFLELWQKPCFYSGTSIETIGVDRIDNTKGYTIENIRPCCGVCNHMKHTMGDKEFILHCEKITKNHT